MDSDKAFFNRLNEYFKDNIVLSYVTDKYVIIVTKEDKFYEFERKDVFRNALITMSENNSVIKYLIEKSIVSELCEKQVIDLKNGENHTIARTVNGKVYCWGSNVDGLLGNGRVSEALVKPELNQYLIDKQIIDIRCGAAHTLVLTFNGEVYAWGINSKGQIGNGSNCNVSIPFHVNGFYNDKVKAIACGGRHSMVLTDTGKVFSWGFNEYGQLGSNFADERCYLPKLIKISGVIKISCGSNHSLLLSSFGDIYVFGSNRGQLGTDIYNGEKFTNIKLVHPNKYIDIASHSLYDISAALSENSLYFAWGQCGEQEIREPKEIDTSSFDDIFAHYFQINYKPIEKVIIPFDETFFQNQKYEIEFNELEKLGKGSFGEVFKVENRDNGNFFAIKKIRFSFDCEREFIKELETISVIKGLWERDKRVAKYFDVWLEDQFESRPSRRSISEKVTLYIQMEIYEKSLREIIREIRSDSNLLLKDCLTPLGYYIASAIFIEILEGVNSLHNKYTPIIHRDLKPDNIMLTNEIYGRVVRIADFGLATTHEFEGQSHTADRGDIRYAAREVLIGRKYDTKADIYSLGVTLQDLFNIDFNRKYVGDENSHLMTKYQALSDLCCKMTRMRFRDRPNCVEILNEKRLWALTFDEPEVQNQIKDIEATGNSSDSFVYRLIKYKQIENVVKQLNVNFLRDNWYTENFHETGKVIGKGCYGEVIKVESEKNKNEAFAVKKIKFTNELARQFRKELKTSSVITDLRHERLVKYFDVWLENNVTKNSTEIKTVTLYIQMELCDKTLKDINVEIQKYFKEGEFLTPLGYYMASQVFIETLEGVNYLHNKSLIHRDIKPDNILLKIELNSKKFVKIADFGLLAIHKDKSLKITGFSEHNFAEPSHSAGVGAWKYAASEKKRGRKYDHTADIYSLGVVCHDLFIIDLNCEYEDEIGIKSQLLRQKYQKISDLCETMIRKRVIERPHKIGDILTEQGLWALCEKEEYETEIFDARKEFEILSVNSDNIKETYVYSMLRLKLFE